MIHRDKSRTRRKTLGALGRLVLSGTPQTWLVRALAIVPASLLLLAVVVQPYVDPRWLFVDTLSAIERSGDCCSVYFGLLSNLGIYIWISTGVVGLFSALLLYNNPGAPRSWWVFALVVGCFSGWLALDDAFQLHEKVLPFLGIPQTVVLLGYASFAVLYAAIAIPILARGDVALFLFACGCLAASLVTDQVAQIDNWKLTAFEDGAKFLGICCWSAFHLSLLYDLLREYPRSRLVILPANRQTTATPRPAIGYAGQRRMA